MTTILNKIEDNPLYYLFVGLYLLWTALVAIIGVGVIPGNIHIFTNQRSSMLPLISSDSLTLVVPQDSYQVGDIISYYQEQEEREFIVTHRIYQLGGNVYLTKGDYNQAIDQGVVLPRHIIGKVTLVVPYLGSIFGFVKTILGNLLLLILPAIFIIIIEIKRFHRS